MEYDLIIVGGGPSSAGLLRGILTRIKDRPNKPRIAVVERGGNNNELSSPHHHISNMSRLHHWFDAAHYTANSTSSNLSTTALHATTPQDNLHHRILDVPTGRGWGGTTNIHAGLFVSPPEEDFDAWPDTWKKRLPASVDAIVKVFQRRNAVEVSKSTIPTHVTIRHVAFHPVTTSSIESKRISYYSVLVSSLLDEYPELRECITFLSGVKVERILIGGESKSGRWDNRAWGVQCRRVLLSSNPLKSRPEQEQQHLFVLRAKSSIVLCAGTIGSPSLLLASGVGEESDLIAAGIQPWYDEHSSNPTRSSRSDAYRNLAVGRGLRDHILVPRIFLTSRYEDDVSSINSIRGWWTVQESMNDGIGGSKDVARYQLQLADGVAIDKMIPHFAAGFIRRKWRFFGRSFSPTLVSGAFYRLRAMLQCIYQYIPGVRSWLSIHFASVNVCLMNPRSVGKIGLRRQNIPSSSVTSINSPSRLSEFQVVIDPGYLSDTRDVHALWRGWKMTAFVKSQCGDWIELLPGYCFVVLFKMCECFVWIVRWLGMLVFGTNGNHVDNCGSNNNTVPQWFRGYVSEFAVPYYHWFGTCAMGPVNANHRHNNNNSEFVVDELLRVRGISGLRICDASVFPDCVTVPTALTCAALGYASAEFVQCDLNETNVY